ncbi:MAG TPA: HAMP domain-containing sensor histidine kinase [Candidatus Limnocylindrales bacterium]|nr:HAMP domain-containing sensor histidine kinase [Candidatus Limnocylindrales bacterium]
MSLRSRLALFGAGVVALALVVFGVLLYALLSRGVVTNQDDALRTRAHDAVATLGAAPPPQSPVAPANLGHSTDVFIEVLADDGSVVFTTGVLSGSPPLPSSSLLKEAQMRDGAFATQGSLRLYVQPFGGGYVLAGQSTRVPQSSLSGIVVFLIVSAVPALVAALVASWLVAGRALRPLRVVASAAEEIGRTRDFGRRLPAPRSRDEVATLTASFNGMLSRLQDAFESQRRFVADASHELRTPLTTIQGNAGLLASKAVSEDVRRAAVADLVQESGRMARLIDRLLTLARADSGLQLQVAALDLGSLVDAVCRQASAAHPGQQLVVETSEVKVEGDEDALRQLVWNLLDNAFRYASSAVEVRLHAETGWARLVIADDGPGIPSAYRERVFERFYRADSSRTGPHAGLGLSIARWIVEQHRGRIIAGEAKLGGAAFLVDLPLLSAS